MCYLHTKTKHQINFTLIYIKIKTSLRFTSNLEMGNAKGNVSSMKNFVSQIVWAPTARPCLEQSAWGTISPMITIASVAPMTATIPDVKVSNKIVKVLFTKTLPWKKHGQSQSKNKLSISVEKFIKIYSQSPIFY